MKIGQFTDTHATLTNGRIKHFSAAAQFSNKLSLEAVIHNGDFVGDPSPQKDNTWIPQLAQAAKNATPILQQTQKLIQENDIKSIDDLAKLSEDDQKFLMESQQQATQVALKPVIETYAAINEEFKKFDAPVYANLGNWDLTVAYQIMDAVTFVENQSSVNVNGVTLQATTNTGEVPKYYNDPALAQFLQPHFINYATGYDSPETKDANNADLKRLESGKPADIMMYHKTPNTSEDKIGSGTSAKEYLQDSSNVLRLGGHFHGSKIEHENGHPVLRPNPDEFFVIDYDESNKKVRHVDVYTIN